MCLPAEPSHSAGKMPWKGQFLKKYFFDELVTFKETQKKAGGQSGVNVQSLRGVVWESLHSPAPLVVLWQESHMAWVS